MLILTLSKKEKIEVKHKGETLIIRHERNKRGGLRLGFEGSGNFVISRVVEGVEHNEPKHDAKHLLPT